MGNHKVSTGFYESPKRATSVRREPRLQPRNAAELTNRRREAATNGGGATRFMNIQ
jgi:hypothetical protein